MTTRRALGQALALGALLGAAAGPAWAQVAGPATRDVVRVSVGADITFDPASGLYTYTYRVTNDTTSARDVSQFAISSGERVDNVTGPQGWTPLVDTERGVVSWVATTTGPPPGDAHDGTALPRPSRIKPGDTVTGFSFQSPDPPAPARFRARGLSSPPTGVEGRTENEPDREADGTTLAPRHAPVVPPLRRTVYGTPRD